MLHEIFYELRVGYDGSLVSIYIPMILKVEMIAKIFRRKSLVYFCLNKNNETYMHPVWLVSFRVEDNSNLKMEVVQLKIVLDHEFGKFCSVLL
jgi:hypothetical protein